MDSIVEDEVTMIIKALESLDTYMKIETMVPASHAQFLQQFGESMVQILSRKTLPRSFCLFVQRQPLVAMDCAYRWFPYAAKMSNIEDPYELLYSKTPTNPTLLHLIQMLFMRMIMEQLIPMSLLQEYPNIIHWFNQLPVQFPGYQIPRPPQPLLLMNIPTPPPVVIVPAPLPVPSKWSHTIIQEQDAPRVDYKQPQIEELDCVDACTMERSRRSSSKSCHHHRSRSPRSRSPSRKHKSSRHSRSRSPVRKHKVRRLRSRSLSRSTSPPCRRLRVEKKYVDETTRRRQQELIITDYFGPQIKPLCLFSLLHKNCIAQFDARHGEYFDHLTTSEKDNKDLVDALNRYCLYSNRIFWTPGMKFEPCRNCVQGNCKFDRAKVGRCSRTDRIYVMLMKE